MKPVAGIAALALVATATPGQALAPNASGAAALAHARGLYYSLERRGFASAECQVRPDWQLMVGQPRNAQTENAYAIFDQLRFELNYIPGKAKVVSKDLGGPRSGQIKEGVDQISSGMNLALDGMFSTWGLFMVVSPLPSAATPTTIAAAPGGYLLSYKDAGSDVTETLRANGEIALATVRNPEFVSSIEPTFSHTPDGLILASYKASYTPTSGKGVVGLDVHITYQTMNGLQFPALADIDSTMDGQRSRVRLSLEDCTLTKK